MKKLALILACMLLIGSVAVSCANSPDVGEYTPGVLADGGYSSDWLGLEFVPTDNLYLSTAEEIEELLELSADMFYVDEDTGEEVLDWTRVTTVYEMMATDEINGDSVIVMAEKLGDTGISVDEYIDALKSQIELQTEISVRYGSPSSKSIAGARYTRFEYVLIYEGIEIGQTMYLRKQGDRMIAICITAEDAEAEAELVACFKKK